MKKICLSIALVLLAVLISSCTNLQAPVSVFQKYEVVNVGLRKADIAFLFDIENPNNIPIGFKDISYSIALDGHDLMAGTYEGFSVQAKEKRSVRIPIEIDYAKLIGNAAHLVKKFLMKDDGIKYKLEGQASVVDNIGFSARVPFNADGEIKFF